MLVHDAVTLSNKTKYYSIAIQFIDEDWDSNHVVALSFGKVTSTAAGSIAPLIQGMIKEMIGFSIDIIVASSVQDCAALNFASELDLEKEKCTMH